MVSKEILNLRTEKAKTLDIGGSKRQLRASLTAMHYEDKYNKWQDIDMTIVSGSINTAPYDVDLLTNKIGYSITNKKDGGRIDVKLKDYAYRSPTTVSGNKAVWEDLDTDFDLMMEFRPKWIRVWKILKSDKAPKSITFTIIEDDEKNEMGVRDQISGRDDSGKPTISSKVESEETKYQTEVSKKNVKEYDLTQTFEDKVVVTNSGTRVKSESMDVVYPVVIDADVQISVDDTADDGMDVYGNMFGNASSTFSTTNSYNFINNLNATFMGQTWISTNNSFTRFDGITIPQSATIDDATLNIYSIGQGIGPPSMKVLAFDENDPDAPTTGGDLIDKTTGIASNVITTSITNSATGAPTKNDFDLQAIDVEDIVQELVNSYDYSNEAMLFFYRNKLIYTSVYAARAGLIYDYTWGSSHAAELVINYTAAATGYSYDVNGVASANIGEVNGIPTANIAEINGV